MHLFNVMITFFLPLFLVHWYNGISPLWATFVSCLCVLYCITDSARSTKISSRRMWWLFDDIGTLIEFVKKSKGSTDTRLIEKIVISFYFLILTAMFATTQMRSTKRQYSYSSSEEPGHGFTLKSLIQQFKLYCYVS